MFIIEVIIEYKLCLQKLMMLIKVIIINQQQKPCIINTIKKLTCAFVLKYTFIKLKFESLNFITEKCKL